MADDGVRYARAPITEATINIQIAEPNSLDLPTLAGLQQTAGKDYPEQQQLISMEGQLTAGDHVSASARQQAIGFLFARSDSLRGWQARLTGFAFNHLAPYTSWNEFESEARRLWNAYRQLVPNAPIVRVGMRYINHITIPLPGVEITHYLRTYPEIASELPQTLSGYFMQLQIPQEDIQSMLIINQALMAPSQPGMTSILLDLDLVRDFDPPQEEEAIWHLLSQFRQRKNAAFEACITDEVRRVIG